MMNYRILADGHTVHNDTWQTGLNNNDIIIGPSGAGKTRGYVKPNILQTAMQGKESMIITDTKGQLCRELGGLLRQHGYNVLELNLADCSRSCCGYNPLEFVRYDKASDSYNTQDIMRIAAILTPVESNDAFWDYYARQLLAAMISYVLECLPRCEHNLNTVVRLFRETGTKNFDKLFAELSEIAPDSFAATQYQMFRLSQSAEKMYSSTLGILAEKLSVFAVGGVTKLFTHPQRVRFYDLANKKTAVFLRISDTDRSMDRLATLFYTQALQNLCGYADRQPGGRLPVPVRLYLDDFAAAADCCIPDFDKITSVIRSREISVSVILQSLSQLEAAYSHAKALTILNNADHLLYLGGQDVETAKYISIKADKSVSTVLNMPLDCAYLFTRGKKPEQVRKYTLENHPLYAETPEHRRQIRESAAERSPEPEISRSLSA